MKFKIEIRCHACNCRYEIGTERFSEQTLLRCPTCAKPLPQSIAQNLTNGILAFQKVPELVTKEEGQEFNYLVDDNDDSIEFTMQVRPMTD